MGVTATDLQNLIITSLANADPTALAGLQTNVPRYWVLYNRQGVLLELQYWYTRREAIRYLMGCLNRQVDYVRRENSASRTLTASSRQDMEMTASASEVGSGVADRSMSSSYSAETNASGSGSGSMNRSASQTMSANGSMSDTGIGVNESSQTSELSSSSSVNASSSDSISAARQQQREVTGFHRRFNSSGKASVGIQVGLNLAATNTRTNELEDGTIQDSQHGQGASSSVSYLTDARGNDSAQSSEQSSSSSFNANAVTANTMAASGASQMSASSASSFSSSGSGSGTMTSTGAGNSSMTASATRVMDADGEAHRLSQAESTMTSAMEKLHQRVLHLQELWKKANEMIAWFEKQRLNLPAYTLQAIAIQYPDGLNADAANAYLVRTPFGLGNGT